MNLVQHKRFEQKRFSSLTYNNTYRPNMAELGEPQHLSYHRDLGRGGRIGAGATTAMALSLIHISEPTRLSLVSRMPSSA